LVLGKAVESRTNLHIYFNLQYLPIVIFTLPWNSLAEGDKPPDWPNRTVKHVWNVGHACVAKLFRDFHKANNLPLGPVQPSSPSTKELNAITE